MQNSLKISDNLKRLQQLRENLDKKRTRKDYHINKKIKVKERDRTYSDFYKMTPRKEVKELINEYQLEINCPMYTTEMEYRYKREYQTFPFNSKYHLASILGEFAKNARQMVFLLNSNNSIYWDSGRHTEIRVVKK
ncbi:hypothetical protein K9M42_03205 [Patescibacteria group bacterium]|nr:hypothetical protein [Patescibacteria group bacterium]